MGLAVRTQHILKYAGRIGHGIRYCCDHPEDCPGISRMLAIHVVSEKEWQALRNGGRISYLNLIGEKPDWR